MICCQGIGSRMWLDLYTNSSGGNSTVQNIHTLMPERTEGADAAEIQHRENMNSSTGKLHAKSLRSHAWKDNKLFIVSVNPSVCDQGHQLCLVCFIMWLTTLETDLTGQTEAFLYVVVWTYTVNNRCHGICYLVGSAGVAHGSTVESLLERLWEAVLDRCGFSPSLSHWDSDSFWAA